MTAASADGCRFVSGIQQAGVVPARLSDLVPSISDEHVNGGARSARRATARSACWSPRIGLRASTSAGSAIVADNPLLARSRTSGFVANRARVDGCRGA
jgi:hypothetical protein